jgi:uncharacterized protein
MLPSFKPSRRQALALLGLAILPLSACDAQARIRPNKSKVSNDAARLITAARAQIGITLNYDPSYTQIPYPNGDVPRKLGVCTDVVIRAYRDALDIDLQQLVHEDMSQNFSVYPTFWGLERPDSNIDHRRVLNLQTYLKRQRANLPITANNADWQPGDIVTSLVNGKLPHIGIVSDRVINNRPLVIHNIGRGTQEEDILFAFQNNGHFRWRL